MDSLPKPPRVVPEETVADTVARVPFLRRFLQSQDDFDVHVGPKFRCVDINQYLGYEYLTKKGFTRDAGVVDHLLLEAWKRGDIDADGNTLGDGE